MNCDDVREAAGAYAIGALDAHEARELERHLAEPGPHQGCRAAVAEARSTALALAGAVSVPAVPPPSGLWVAIEARAVGARAGAAPTGVAPPRDAARRVARGWRPFALGAAAAAAAALVIAALLGTELRRERAAARAAARERDLVALQEERALQAEALALLDRPGARVVPLEPQPGQSGRATAILDPAGGRALVVSASLPPQPGKDYQLWVIRGAEPPQPAGFLRRAGRAVGGDIDPALLTGAPPDAFAVSLEPAGGSPAPTQVLLVGKVSG